MVLTTGVFNNMRSMISGWYKEKVPASAEPPAVGTIAAPAVETLGDSAPQPIVEPTIPSERREPGPQSPAGSAEATAESQKTGGKNDTA